MTQPPDEQTVSTTDTTDPEADQARRRIDPIVALSVVLTLTGIAVTLGFLLKGSTIGTLTQSTTDCGSVLSPQPQPDGVSYGYCDLTLTQHTAYAIVALGCTAVVATFGALTARRQRFRRWTDDGAR